MPVLPPFDVTPYDTIVIGAGIVGAAIARGFAIAGAKVLILEKAEEFLDGASKANSAILHTGFDAPPASLEQACIAAGYAEYMDIHPRLNLPLVQSGALVIAWTPEEEALLPDLMAQAHRNGVTDVTALDQADLRRLEPELGPAARAAFRVPREYLVDPWQAPYAYLLQAIAHGATVARGCEVTGGQFDGALWTLETAKGPVRAKQVINAAGLYGDLVDKMLTGQQDFHIRPRKGQFILYDKPAAALAGHILLPVPNKVTKGIVVCRTVFGNLLVGPTAEDQDDRAHAMLVEDTLDALRQRGEEILPALKHHDITALYAGLRPASEFKDFQIKAHEGMNYISVGGIRSTGLSAALGIAKHVLALAQRREGQAQHWPQVPNISEYFERDWQRAGHGGVVCHCEMVTRREIMAALDGPLPATTLAGLKRRTRVTMGRCQGFFCTPELARITKGRLTTPMAEDIA